MKLNKIALALVAATTAPMAAHAGVTVTPVLLGYHSSDDISDTADKQRDVFRTGKNLYQNKNGDTIGDGNRGNDNGGVAQESGLYTGAALGIELTPSTQFQVEYGVSNTNGEASEDSADAGVNRFDVENEMITGNFLVGSEAFTGYTDNKLKPYMLVGAGQSKTTVENQESYEADADNGQGIEAGDTVKSGTEVANSKDTIGNLGVGAMYRVNDALSLRGEARAVRNFDNDWWEGMALGGLEVVLGGHLAPTVPVPPAAQPAPVDNTPTPQIDTTPLAVVDTTPQVVPVQPQAVDSDGDGVDDQNDACPNTPTNVVVDERGCPKKVDVGNDLKMELRVFFDNDKSTVKAQYKPEIAKVAEKMREYPNSVARIEGHASKTGPSARYNQRLSEARAMAVKSVLTNQFGVAPGRLSTIGYGYTRPIASNDTAEGRAKNRRVYAIITGDKTETVTQTKDMDVQ